MTSSTPISLIINNNAAEKKRFEPVDDSVDSLEISSNSVLPQASQVNPNTSVVISKNKEKKKAVRRNITKDGKIDNEKLRTGRDLSDKMYAATKTLLSTAEKLHKTTNAAVYVCIKPLTDRGKVKSYRSDNFNSHLPKKTLKNSAEFEVDEIEAQVESSENEVAFEVENKADVEKFTTPEKRLGGSSKVVEGARSSRSNPQNICRICKTVANSAEDEEMNSMWIGCATKRCPFWVHAKCACICYPNTKKGRKELGAWAEKHFLCPDHMPDESSEEEELDKEPIFKSRKIKRLR